MDRSIMTHKLQCRARTAGHALIAGMVLLLLAACGGGGGGGSQLAPQPGTPPPATPTPAPTDPVPVDPAPVDYIMDEFFTDKSFAGMRSLIKTAVPDNPLEAALLNCTVLMTESSLCSFNQLSLLGMVQSAPTVDDIMARTLVSHDWMAVRLREVLERMPPAALLMMRGITAVVISYDVRPSFYWQGSGAIYLDPERIWLTEVERATIDTAPDFRADLGDVFQFLIPSRYVAAGDVDIRALDRNLDSVVLRMAALLFHELAHANDFYPPGQVASIDRTVPMYRAVLTGNRPSSLLQGSLPLTSALMQRLAGVSFLGDRVLASDQLLTAEDIAGEFPADVASDFYSYSSEREDLAMLFEEAMMYFSFGIRRDVAVTNLPPELETCDQLLVAWGERHRISTPAIQPRIQQVLAALLPELAADVGQQIGELVPVPMRVGEDFCANISLDPAAARSLVQPGQEAPGKALLPAQFLPYL